MRQLNFAAQPNCIQEFREDQRLFRRDLEQTMHGAFSNRVLVGWHERRVAERSGYRSGSYHRRLLTSASEHVLTVPGTREHAGPLL